MGVMQEREVFKKYWIEHSVDLTVEAMMLDSKASDLDKEERPEVFVLFLVIFDCIVQFDSIERRKIDHIVTPFLIGLRLIFYQTNNILLHPSHFISYKFYY